MPTQQRPTPANAASPPETPRVRAVVVDFDGTIADDQGGFHSRELIDVFKRLRKQGVKIIINTGRDLGYLIGPDGLTTPEHVALFDAAIVECGGAVWYPGDIGARPLTQLHSPEILSELRRLHVPASELWPGHAMIALRRVHAPVMHRAIAAVNRRRIRAGHTPIVLDEIVNNGSATYLPPGVNKGSALIRVVVEGMGINPGAIVGAGDGANDLPFLALCGAAIVPLNANPRVKALGNAILAGGRDAAGLAEELTKLLDNGLRMPNTGFGDRAVA